MASRSQNNILVSGSLAYDFIMDFPGYFKDHVLPEKVHVLNVSFGIDGIRENYGGTAGNIVYNLKLLGENPHITSSVGKDFGRYGSWFADHGIIPQYLHTNPKELTARAYIITDRANNQITAFHAGAMRKSSYSAFTKNASSVNPKKTIGMIAPGNTTDMIQLGRWYKQRRIPYVFDPGQVIPTLQNKDILDLLSDSKIFVVNDYESSMVLHRLRLSIKDVQRMAEIVIITKGDEGSTAYADKKQYIVRAVKPRKIVDPTGAGDAFRAGLLKGIIMGYPLEKTLKLASLAATYPIEHYGTQEHRFSFSEIRHRFSTTFIETL